MTTPVQDQNSDYLVALSFIHWLLNSERIPDMVLDALASTARQELETARKNNSIAVQEALELFLNAYGGDSEYSVDIFLTRYKDGTTARTYAIPLIEPCDPRKMMRTLQQLQRIVRMAGQVQMGDALERALTVVNQNGSSHGLPF